MQDLLRGSAAWRRGPAEGMSPLLLQVSQVWDTDGVCLDAEWYFIIQPNICIFVSSFLGQRVLTFSHHAE